MSRPAPSTGSDPLDPYDIRASAPGRVEFIGNHTDYNGGWVLGATINRRVEVGITRRSDTAITLDSTDDVPSVHASLDAVERRSGEQAWANYVLGVLAVLRDEGLAVDTGFDLRVASTLPTGAGLSSSAALELATAFALTEAFDGDFGRRELVHLAQRAENEFVGVPCGLLDQAVVAFGDAESLVRIDARSGDIATVPFPAHTALWIFRTPQAHALADAPYQERHDEAREVRNRLDTLLQDGLDCLAEVSPDQLERMKRQLPETLYRRARHVSTEHRRVQRAVQLLEDKRYEAAGDLLFESHESSRTDYENSTAELDFIVECLSEAEPVLGARLTGGGFGGAAMAWTRTAFGEAEAQAVADAYVDRFGDPLDILSCQPAHGACVLT